MVKQGHCFGSHTGSHVPLASFPKSDTELLESELARSLARIRQLTDNTVHCFCYPFGSISESVKSHVIDAGYNIAVCSRGGGNRVSDDLFTLKRLAIDNKDSMNKFIRKVNGAYDWWYGWLLPLITRNKHG